MAADIGGQVPDDPSADDRVVRHNQNGNDGVDPAAEPQPALFAERRERADRAFAGHTAQCGFRHNHCVAESYGQHNVDQQKNTAAVFGGKVGETPDVAKPDGGPGGGQHKSNFARKGTAL